MASKTVNELTLKLNADAAELKKDLAKVKGQMTGFKNSMSGIGASLKNLFAIGDITYFAQKVFQLGKEMMELGAQADGTTRAFNALNEPNLLNNLREATGGTISDLKLMQTALDADDMGVPVEKLATFFQYARNEVQETGGSVTELVNKIVVGIGKNSTRALTELGISQKAYKEEFKKTGDMMEAITNIMNKKIKESGTYIETAADVTARWGASWDNIKSAIGMVLNQALVKIAPVIDEIASYLKGLWTDFINFFVDTYNGWVNLYNESAKFRIMVEAIAQTFNFLWQTIKVIKALIYNALKSWGKAIGYFINPDNWGKGFLEGFNKIMAENAQEMTKTVVDYGKNIGNSLLEGVENVKKGGAELLSIEDFIMGGSGGGLSKVKEKAKDAGQEIVKEIDKGVKENSPELENTFAELGKSLGESLNESFKRENMDVGQFDALTAGFTNAAKGMYVTITDISSMVGDAVSQFTETLFTNLGGGLNGMISIFDGILSIIADFAMSMGKQLIGLGIAALAAKKLMLNPAAAIAAGIALVAIGALTKKLINSGGPKFAQGGIVPGNAYRGDRVPVMANSGEMILNGAQQSSLFRQIGSGGRAGGGVLSCTVQGDALLFVLEQAKKKQSYTY